VGIVGRVAKRPLATKTQNTKHTTTNMSRRHPTSQRLCPLPPWLGQRHPPCMARQPSMIPYEATVVRFGGTMVGLLVWGVPHNTRRKIERWTFLGLNSFTIMGLGRNEKLTPRRISMVGVVDEFCRSPTQHPTNINTMVCRLPPLWR